MENTNVRKIGHYTNDKDEKKKPEVIHLCHRTHEVQKADMPTEVKNALMIEVAASVGLVMKAGLV